MTPNRSFLFTFAVASLAEVLGAILPPASHLRAAVFFGFYAALFSLGVLIGWAGDRISSLLVRACPFFVLHLGTAIALFLADRDDPSQLIPADQTRNALVGVLFVSPAVLAAFLALASLGFLCGRLLRRYRQSAKPAA